MGRRKFSNRSLVDLKEHLHEVVVVAESDGEHENPFWLDPGNYACLPAQPILIDTVKIDHTMIKGWSITL